MIYKSFPEIQDTLAQMCDEILMEMRYGRIPWDVKSFSELHDYIDANELGGFCDDDKVDAMIAAAGGRDTDEGMPDALMQYFNDCQGAIDFIIKDGYFLRRKS